MDSKHWFWGHLSMLTGPGEEGLLYYRHMVQQYPKACALYMGNFIRPYVVVHHPDTVREVLQHAAKKPDLFGIYRYGKQYLGNGLLMTHGNKWHRNRKLLNLPFYFENLKHYVEVYNKATDIYLDNLLLHAKRGDSLEIYKLSSMLTLDIILKCLFSYDSGVQVEGMDNFYLNAVEEITRLWAKRYYDPLMHYDFIYHRTKDGKAFTKSINTVNDLSDKLIAERKMAIEKDSSVVANPDFLDLLLKSKDEDGNGLTAHEIKDEVNTFIFGGHDTTASTIAWTLYSLAGSPYWQKRCQDEIDQLFDGRDNGRVNREDTHNLPVLTMCLKESMRLHSIVPFIERELDQDTIIDGKKVPSGTPVMLLIYSLHHNPHIWKDPLNFDPERFSEENIKKMDPFAFRPFSAGPRTCIAQNFAMDEIKVVLSKVLRRFNFTKEENHVPNKMMVIAMRSTNGLMLKVSERE